MKIIRIVCTPATDDLDARLTLEISDNVEGVDDLDSNGPDFAIQGMSIEDAQAYMGRSAVNTVRDVIELLSELTYPKG